MLCAETSEAERILSVDIGEVVVVGVGRGRGGGGMGEGGRCGGEVVGGVVGVLVMERRGGWMGGRAMGLKVTMV